MNASRWRKEYILPQLEGRRKLLAEMREVVSALPRVIEEFVLDENGGPVVARARQLVTSHKEVEENWSLDWERFWESSPLEELPLDDPYPEPPDIASDYAGKLQVSVVYNMYQITSYLVAPPDWRPRWEGMLTHASALARAESSLRDSEVALWDERYAKMDKMLNEATQALDEVFAAIQKLLDEATGTDQ